MVKATLTPYNGEIVQCTFQDMDALTDYLKINHGKYKAIDARVIRTVKDIRQGREDRTVV